MKYDLFILSVEDDQVDMVTPLIKILQRSNTNDCLLKDTINLENNINEKLSISTYIIIIFSNNFFKNRWLCKEFNSIVTKNRIITIHILHNIIAKELNLNSLLLNEKIIVSTKFGIDSVARELLTILNLKKLNWRSKTVIGISGGSCSGKSWFSRKIKELRPNSVCLFDLDSYYKDVNYVNNLEFKHDNPDAIDYERALKDFESLLNGEVVEVPLYDYDTHEIVGKKICTPAPLIVIEGLFVFTNKKFLDRMNLKIWIEANETIKYRRRINRDIKERGDSLEGIKYRYVLNVRPAYRKYISPCKEYADVIYCNNSNNENDIPLLIQMLFSLAD